MLLVVFPKLSFHVKYLCQMCCVSFFTFLEVVLIVTYNCKVYFVACTCDNVLWVLWDVKSFYVTSGPWITNSPPLSVILKNSNNLYQSHLLEENSFKVLQAQRSRCQKERYPSSIETNFFAWKSLMKLRLGGIGDYGIWWIRKSIAP